MLREIFPFFTGTFTRSFCVYSCHHYCCVVVVIVFDCIDLVNDSRSVVFPFEIWVKSFVNNRE